MNKTYIFAMILLVLAAVVILSGCAGKSGTSNGNANTSTTPTPRALTPAQTSAAAATLNGNNTSSAANIKNASHGRRLYNIELNHTMSNKTINVSA